MDRHLDIPYLRTLLSERGWQQGDLAQAVGVSDAAVSQWLSGEHLPRAGMLLKIAMAVKAPVDKLLVAEPAASDKPLVAYRRKGQQQTTAFQEDEALDQGFALERLASLLGPRLFKPREFSNPTTAYDHVEELAATVRPEISPRDVGAVDWAALVAWFAKQQAILVPVFWGERENHGNALHIHLPSSGHTFIYINLDSEELDFKFWLAHEMAHMLTPSMVGTDEGEDFSDAFAGALLFPQRLAAAAYRAAVSAKTPTQSIQALERAATEAGVSLHTVFMQCDRLAKAKGTAPLVIKAERLHQTRRLLDRRVGKIRRHFFSDSPTAKEYVSVCESRFGTKFFQVLAEYLETSASGPTFIRRVLHCPMKDAVALHEELRGARIERSAD